MNSKEVAESSASPINLTLTSTGIFAPLSHCLIFSTFSAVLKSFFVFASIMRILAASFLPIEKILFEGRLFINVDTGTGPFFVFILRF